MRTSGVKDLFPSTLASCSRRNTGRAGNKTIGRAVLSCSHYEEMTVADDQALLSRRKALKCMAFGGAGTLFALAGGVFTPIDIAAAATDRRLTAWGGKTVV